MAAPSWSQEGGTLLGTHHRCAAGALLELLGPEPGCIYPASDRKSRGPRSRRLRLLGTTESFFRSRRGFCDAFLYERSEVNLGLSVLKHFKPL